MKYKIGQLVDFSKTDKLANTFKICKKVLKETDYNE